MTKKQVKPKKEALDPKIDKKKMDKFDDERVAYDVTIRNLKKKVEDEHKLRLSEEIQNAFARCRQSQSISDVKFDRNIFIASTVIFAFLFLISIL